MSISDLFRLLKRISSSVKLILILLLLHCYTNKAFGQSYPYKFNYLTVDDGLSHTDANDIVQDSKGYMWIATYFGIDRFDGYSTKKFYNSSVPLDNAYNNRVQSLLADDEGKIWLNTEGGFQCFDSKTEKYSNYIFQPKRSRLSLGKFIKAGNGSFYDLTDNRLKILTIDGKYIREQEILPPSGVVFSNMTCDHSGNLYLTSNKGLWLLLENRKLENISITGAADLNLTQILFDNQHNLLVSTNRQLFFIAKAFTNPKKTVGLTVTKQFQCPEGVNIRSYIEDRNSNYWLNSGSSLLLLDSNLKQTQILATQNGNNSLNSSSLGSIYIDKSQCLWVCTFGGGVNYCDLNEKKFYTFRHNPEVPNSISGSYVRSVLDADGQNLWIGTNDNGLNLYNFQSKKFSFYNTYNSALRLKNSNDITALALDNEHNLWIGSISGIEVMAPDKRSILTLPGSENFPRYAIDVLTKDCYGNIWFGNHMNRFGVIIKDVHGRYRVKYYGEGYSILADKVKPELFISSTHGLSRIFIDKEGDVTQISHYEATGKPNSLSSNYTYPVGKQNDSTYWVGTIGGGLDRLIVRKDNSYTITPYTKKYGIFNDVESLEVDDDGNVWMGGNGLLCLNPATGKLIRYDKNDGLQGNSFKVGSACKGVDGRLFFGGINGLNFFYPNQIMPNMIPARPILTDLLISNQKPAYAMPDTAANVLPQIISYSKSLTFNYLQNNFVISFSAMHFANPLKCKYRYKLIGFDKDWKFTDGRNPTAAYSNLDYSNYRFIVESTNNDSIWSPGQASLQIIVTPPWWKSVLAKIIYAALFIAGLLWLYIYQARWYRLKRELAVRAVNENKREEMHKQREELYQQQLQFFTNISHEFRTPLTLILGPLENLINENTNSFLHDSYQLMYRNVKRLINLINELMNFKKVADSVIKLQVQPLSIDQFCESIFLEFENLAINKDIRFKLANDTPATGQDLLSNLFDAQILEKILFNLLNNAFKYTNPGGQVTLSVFFEKDGFKPAFTNDFNLLNEQHTAKKYIYFLVADTGIGISKDSITNIFDRYYQIGRNHLGSGVGLALVKSLIQLHKGNISVYSERNRGTEFLVALPWGAENYTASEIIHQGSELATSQLEKLDISVLTPIHENERTDVHLPEKLSKHILLVDDNQELRAFLRQSLEKYYFIEEAEDGHVALAAASASIPDLIISDVMMPGMSGVELCKLVKDNFETSHIPFIILSAKDALDAKIEGMESGADYYFAKPLSIDLLLLTVHNIFEQGQKLKLKYTNDYLTEATELVHSEKDKDFMNKLLKLIEDNIEDADLDVDFLCDNLYISRTKLYQKIKSISDQSVGEFIRTTRLKKAIQIMTHEDIPLNEVADRIGLQSHAYFSRSFRKEFGKSPSQFLQSLKKNIKV